MNGIGVSPGTATAPVHHVTPPVIAPDALAGAVAPAGRPGEAARVRAALDAVADGYTAIAAGAAPEVAEVLAAGALMARDPSLVGAAEAAVTGDGFTAEAAIWTAAGSVRDRLAGLGGYLAERASDLDDIRVRAVAWLRGVAWTSPAPDGPHVVVAVDLSPADTAALDLDRVCAFVTEKGGATGHSAILARMLGIPAVVACTGVTDLAAGRVVAVDGTSGVVDPDPPTGAPITGPRRRVAEAAAWAGALPCGHPLDLLANAESVDGAGAGAAAGAAGIGLLRTELLFLDRDDPPSLDEQRALYAGVFAHFPGGRVIVRTLDAGADKPLAFLGLSAEPNPALGIRGFRATPAGGAVLATQLDAIAEAARGGTADVRVMAPMVATAAEAAAFAAAVRARGLKAGVMIEVPAAALTAAAILAEVDFASIGTNDLAQYLFAADRLAGPLAGLLDPWQPALLQLVRAVGEAGRATGRPVGVCGEAASDPLLAAVLAGLGVSSLSMAPPMLAPVARHLAGWTAKRCREAADLALTAPDAATARSLVAAMMGG